MSSSTGYFTSVVHQIYAIIWSWGLFNERVTLNSLHFAMISFYMKVLQTGYINIANHISLLTCLVWFFKNCAEKKPTLIKVMQTCYAKLLSTCSGYCEFNVTYLLCVEWNCYSFLFFFICHILACSCFVCLCYYITWWIMMIYCHAYSQWSHPHNTFTLFIRSAGWANSITSEKMSVYQPVCLTVSVCLCVNQGDTIIIATHTDLWSFIFLLDVNFAGHSSGILPLNKFPPRRIPFPHKPLVV